MALFEREKSPSQPSSRRARVQADISSGAVCCGMRAVDYIPWVTGMGIGLIRYCAGYVGSTPHLCTETNSQVYPEIKFAVAAAARDFLK